jgi:5-methylcytosine-specific restriction endonuclease McrA
MQVKLAVELVPSTCWYKNLRSELSRSKWDILRNECYRNAGYKCEICGGTGSKHPVECHEIWEYDEGTKTQRLLGVQALCPKCHRAKHMGFWEMKGYAEDIKRHMMKINKWDAETYKIYRLSVWAQYNNRSEVRWELDLAWLENTI